MSYERKIVTKLPKQTGAKDFVNWKRRVKAYLQNQGYELLGLRDRPEIASATMNLKWQESNINLIVLSNYHWQMGPCHRLVQSEMRTNEQRKTLWEAPDEIYRISNTQMVTNIEHELETMELDLDIDWETHMESFKLLIETLVSYD